MELCIDEETMNPYLRRAAGGVRGLPPTWAAGCNCAQQWMDRQPMHWEVDAPGRLTPMQREVDCTGCTRGTVSACS
jgi:hypothetical protein